jgi:hypothetical protein
MLAIVVASTLAGLLSYAIGIQTVGGFLWEVPIILMGGAIAAGGSLALGIERSRRTRLAVASMAACLIMWLLFILALFDVQIPGEPDRWPYRTISPLNMEIYTFGVWSCLAVPVLALEPKRRMLRVLRRTALVLGTALAVAWVGYYLVDEFSSFEQTFVKYALVLCSIATTGTVLCLPPALFLDRVSDVHSPKIEIAQLLCPRCGAPCDPNVDDCQCGACQLPIRVDRGEPRCACGYLLVNLSGNTCPECGRAFAARVRYELVEV